MGAVVSWVDPGSVAARYGIQKGDELITINGQLLRDILDYYFVTAEHKLEINYVRDKFPMTTVIHKPAEEPLGLDFTEEVFDGIIKCRNKCTFCFVDQLPPDVRKTLCVKDDDYRLSFLHGSYITLTNIAETDLRRITALRLSPLYVSVHATDPDVRSEIMCNPQAGNILKMLEKLKMHNIQCHTQIVVIPEVNDGKVLKKTCQDLLDLYPSVKSVAVVPVGITTHRRGLPRIRTFKKKDAQHVYELVRSYQQKAQKRARHPFFYMADEIYLLLNKDLPKNRHYGNYEQLSNGVGMARKFITDFNRRKRYLPKKLSERENVWVVTGVLGAKVLKPLIGHFKKVANLSVRLIIIKNKFLGSPVTVTGLLAGNDILSQLQSKLKRGRKPDRIIVPDVVLREKMFLDDLPFVTLKEELGIPVEGVETTARGLIDGVLGDWKKKKTNISKSSQKDRDNETEEEYEEVEPLDWHFDSEEVKTKLVEPIPGKKKYRPRKSKFRGKGKKPYRRKTYSGKGKQSSRPDSRGKPSASRQPSKDSPHGQEKKPDKQENGKSPGSNQQKKQVGSRRKRRPRRPPRNRQKAGSSSGSQKTSGGNE